LSDGIIQSGGGEVKRVAGYVLLAIAFVVNIPLQVSISVYGLIYAIRAFVDSDILTAVVAILIAAVCVAIAHSGVSLVLKPLKSQAARLLSKTDVEATHRDQREWQRKQAEKGSPDRRRSILDAEVQHIRDSLGDISGSDLTGNRQKRA
jgi:hypothetical protein